jgi:hypothetical protein
MAKSKRIIRIENPAAGCGFTSLNRARRFVRKGQAEWAEGGASIRFLESDHRHQSAQRSESETRMGYESAVGEGIAQLAALRKVPILMPSLALGVGRRRGATRSHVGGWEL